MARPQKNEIAPGVYRRGDTYWLRYTPDGGGGQVRISLQTKDPTKAILAASEQRGKPLPGRSQPAIWDRAISKYVKEGLDSKRFRRNTIQSVEYAAKAFKLWSGVTSPNEVTSGLLQAFYDVHSGHRKTAKGERKPGFVNVATAQGYVSKLATFLRRQGLLIRVDFRGRKPDSRDVVVPAETIRSLLDACKRKDLKYVLLAGFHCGFRKEEIIMSRPEWFKLDLGHVAIPKIQTVDSRRWEVKSGRPRKVPLTPDFKRFLDQEFGAWKNQSYMLHPHAKGQRYRWDFRRPFEEYMQVHGLWKPFGKDNVTPHSMRHTYITHLADKGFSAAQISAWSGDRIATIESHYLHTAAPSGAVDQLYSTKTPLTLDQIADSIQQLKGQVGEDTIRSVQELLARSKLPNEADAWKWSKSAPKGHVRLYSVKDTISKIGIFRILIDPGDGQPEFLVTEEDWEEGTLSTERARIGLLHERGWIERS